LGALLYFARTTFVIKKWHRALEHPINFFYGQISTNRTAFVTILTCSRRGLKLI
jgi:hypothetical protein